MNDESSSPHAVFELIGSSDVMVGFDMFVDQALSEIDMSFTLLDKTEADVRPFAMIAEGPDMYSVQWHDLDVGSPDLVDRFLADVLPATLASRDPQTVGLFLTTYLTDPDGRR